MRSRKLVALIAALVMVFATLTFLSVAPRTIETYNSETQTDIHTQLFGNYSTCLIQQNFTLAGVHSGTLKAYALLQIFPIFSFVVSNDSYVPPINMSFNESFIDEYGPSFTLESILYPVSHLNAINATGETYGGFKTNPISAQDYSIVGADFASLLYDRLSVRLDTPSMQVSTGSYHLVLRLLMESEVPYYNSTYSHLLWKMALSNITMDEKVNGYLLTSNPTTTPGAITI